MKTKKCMTYNCTNYDDAGEFEGEFCVPCWEFITTGRGVYSQVFKNVEKHFKDKPTHIISAVYFPLNKQLELTWEEIKSGEKAEIILYDIDKRKGDAIADIVYPCVYHNAITDLNKASNQINKAFDYGKKSGKEEVQNAIIDALGLYDRFDKSGD